MTNLRPSTKSNNDAPTAELGGGSRASIGWGSAPTGKNVMEDKPVSLEDEIKGIKALRRDTDAIIQRVKELPGSREKSLTITKLQEGVMWLGMDLKRINEQTGVGGNPYPNSKDPSNTKIEPTADGLKL